VADSVTLFAFSMPVATLSPISVPAYAAAVEEAVLLELRSFWLVLPITSF